MPDENTIWASGSSGTIALSINGGEHFEWMQVAGYEKRDFRAIHAWNNKEAKKIKGEDNVAYDEQH